MSVLEKDWQLSVVELATYYRWLHFHPYDMRRSDAGWPDVTFVRPDELIFVEFKTEKGRVTPAQTAWHIALASAGQRVFVWRPSMLDVIHEILKPRRERRGRWHSTDEHSAPSVRSPTA